MPSGMQAREIGGRYRKLRAKFLSRSVSATDFLNLGVLYLLKFNAENILAQKEIQFHQAALYLAIAHQIAPRDPSIAVMLARAA
jgi:hypothetical protein